MRVTERIREEGKQLSAMEMADKMQKQINPLFYNLKRSSSLLKMVENLDLTRRWPQYSAVQDLVAQYSKTLSINNDATRTIRELVDSISTNIVALESLKVAAPSQDSLKAARSVVKPPTQFAFPKGWDSGSEVSELNSVMFRITKSIEQYNQFSKLESFKVLSSFDGTSLNEILKTNLTTADIEGFSESSIAEIDAELSDEIKLEKDFSSYSEKAKKILYFFCTAILLSYLIGIASSITANYIQQFQEVSKTLETSREVKSFTRSSPPLIDRQALKGHRVTTANNLNFRHKPSINSNIIEILPIGTIVKVIEKSNRSWLLVEVEIGGEIEQGWVLRRYTTYFK